MQNAWNWIKREWLTVLIAAGIIISLYTVVSSGAARDDRDRDAAIAGCLRGSERTALDAAFQLAASKARAKDGNLDSARYYEGIADGMLLTIAAPTPELRGDRVLMEVQEQHIEGRPRYVLTPKARRLHQQGCERAYLA